MTHFYTTKFLLVASLFFSCLTPLVAENFKTGHHTVVAGETLYTIASKYGCNIGELTVWNDLRPPYELSVGQKLQVSALTVSKWTHIQTDTIHRTLPEFVFKFIGEIPKEEAVIKAINIYRDNKSQPFQTLKIAELEENTPVSDLKVEDINFDGYKDIRLVAFKPAGPNIPYLYWLFDPKTEQFSYNEAFSKITSPEIDAKKQIISSTWRNTPVHYGTSHYKVIDNKPILVWQREEIYLDENQVKVFVQERVGDEMKIISEGIQTKSTEPTEGNAKPANKVSVPEATGKDVELVSEKIQEKTAKPAKVSAPEATSKDIELVSEKAQEKIAEPANKKSITAKPVSVRQRIIISSLVNVRSAPRLNARIVGQLNFGSVVQQLNRSKRKLRVNKSRDYWYKILMPNGKIGWTFGKFSVYIVQEKKNQLYLEIAKKRLQQKLNWFNQKALVNFLAQAKQEVQSPPDIAAELALLYFSSLEKLRGENTEEGVVKHRIITASGVIVRSAPRMNAGRIGQLNFGIVVKELSRFNRKAKFGNFSDYWYKIEMPNGKSGWSFGKFSTSIDLNKRGEVYLDIAKKRLQKKINWSNQVALLNFLARAKLEVQSPPQTAVELALLYFSSLEKLLDKLSSENKQDKSPYRKWLKELEQYGLIVYNEVAGDWIIKADVYWQLHDVYYPLPIAERIAWVGANTPLAGECEGEFECEFNRMNLTFLKYLKYHPTGGHAGKVIDKVMKLLNNNDTPATEEDVALPRLFAVLQETIKRTNHSQILRQIEAR